MGNWQGTNLDGVTPFTPKAGKVYHVSHRRKGEFVMLVQEVQGEFVSGVLVDGVVKAMLRYNVVSEPLEDIAGVRSTLCTLTEIEPAPYTEILKGLPNAENPRP